MKEPDFSHYTGLPAQPDTRVPTGGVAAEPDWAEYTTKTGRERAARTVSGQPIRKPEPVSPDSVEGIAARIFDERWRREQPVAGIVTRIRRPESELCRLAPGDQTPAVKSPMPSAVRPGEIADFIREKIRKYEAKGLVRGATDWSKPRTEADMQASELVAMASGAEFAMAHSESCPTHGVAAPCVVCSGAAALDLLRQPSADGYQYVPGAVTEVEAMQLCAALEKKSGAELDAIGKRLGVPREADPDGRFRLLLQLRVFESANVLAPGRSLQDPRFLGLIERAKKTFRFDRATPETE